MAPTTASAFALFDDEIRLSAPQYARIHSRVGEVRRMLTQAFPPWDQTPLVAAELMGSCARGTAIQPLTDIDILAIFGDAGHGGAMLPSDSHEYVSRVRAQIAERTKIVPLGTLGRSVHVAYADPPGVCLTISLAAASGGYAIPAADGQWIRLNPARQAQWSSARQARLANRYRQRVRTLKCWNRLHGSPLRSWQLEVMIGSMFAAMSADPRLDITHFFAQAPNWIEVPDPGGGLRLSAGMSDADIEATRTLLCDAHIRAAQAVGAEARADRAGALAMWRQLFGEAFRQRA